MSRGAQSRLIGALSMALSLLQADGKVGWFAMRDPQLFWVQTRQPVRLPPGHLPTESLSNWNGLAHELSCLLGGVWWYGAGSVTWKYGPYSLFLQNAAKEEEIWAARMITYETTRISDLPFSVAGCARTLIEWTGITDKSRPIDFTRDVSWHYQHCTPKRVPYARLYDVKSCYATLLARMPSPLVTTYGDGKIAFTPLPKGQRDRWRAMTHAIQGHKGLRNSIVGNMAGVSVTGKGLNFYFQGQKRPGPKMPGPLRSASTLIARTAYELCAEAVAESRAIYANTDCVITEEGGVPSAWDRHGLRVELRAEGESDIRSVGVYRVGKKATKPYKFAHDYYGKVKWYEIGSAAESAPAVAVTVKGPHWAQWLDRVVIK